MRELRILALTRNADSPSFQRRLADYVGPLSKRGIELVCGVMPRGGDKSSLLAEVRRCDGVLWHRYLMPPWTAWRWRRAAKRIIFDFDDPIIYSTRDGGRPSLSRRFKFGTFLRRCDAALAASEYLAQLARRFCRQVFVHKMAVEPPASPPQRAGLPGAATLLWLGSRPTMRYLSPLMPTLERLADLRPDVSLRLVAHEPIHSRAIKIDYRPWSPDEQDQALRECDIGLCPMPDTPWTRGKCPYKVLQYMANSMAWIGSAVGENLAMAGDAQSPRGLCAASQDQWIAALLRFIDDVELRRRVGELALEHVRRYHGIDALADRLADLIRQVIDQPQCKVQ